MGIKGKSDIIEKYIRKKNYRNIEIRKRFLKPEIYIKSGGIKKVL